MAILKNELLETMSVAQAVESLFPEPVSLRIEAYDGSIAGDVDAELTARIVSPQALSYIITAPGEVGMARAYLTGAIEVDPLDPGDPYEALKAIQMAIGKISVRPMDVPALIRSLGREVLQVPPLPKTESPSRLRRVTRGLTHSKGRDADAIHHHYDVSNRFYEMVLGPSMAYTCAVYDNDEMTLEEAQRNKFDLVARKLDLKPGMRLLDVGCGWGGMAMHAAQEYGAKVLAVTLSTDQAQWANDAVAKAGLSGQVEIRHQDYRDVTESDFDAISSIGLTEHIGVKNYPAYFGFLYGKLRPGARLLNHCITWENNRRNGGLERLGMRPSFVDRYIFPDGELAGSGTIVSIMEDTGFEVEHHENFRNHYARTTRAWAQNLSANWDACVAEVGEERARVWGLYLAGSSFGFERNNIQLHQVLGVKLDGNDNRYPWRHSFGA
ncbi:class I SAM-dependent methyltransferase [Kribbia dieselivorans]|uniref:class I SAM-dependent methyltransferase n=1 Tax=Kribbia dieselivorans TaxID=331526 RepID=UPI000838C978|nr:class I SAM-dependent methyltransferase [Kribbia dieselivorans]